MPETTAGGVRIQPQDGAKRQFAHWQGLAVETVQFTDRNSYEYGFRGPVHLFTVCSRAVRVSGETWIDGAGASTLRNFSGKMCFVPAGHAFRGTYVPKVLPQVTYFYLDPARLPVDPEIRFDEIEFAPRLYFEDPALWSTATKLMAQVADPDGGNPLYAEALTEVLVHELVRLQRGSPPHTSNFRGGLAPWQQRAVCEFIEENLADDISLSTLARLTRLSPNHFSRAFKQSLGAPPYRYLNHRRMERAKQLLANPEKSIADVAIACGFRFPGNFAATFGRHTGVSPTAFRRTLE